MVASGMYRPVAMDPDGEPQETRLSSSGSSDEDLAGTAAGPAGSRLQQGLRTGVAICGLLLLLGVFHYAGRNANRPFLSYVSDHALISEYDNSNGGGWKTHHNVWCPKHSKKEYETLEEAKAACGDSCASIYNVRCKPAFGFTLCPNGHDFEDSKVDSCVLSKPSAPPPPATLTKIQLEKEFRHVHVKGDEAKSAKCKFVIWQMQKGMCGNQGNLQSTCAPKKKDLEESCTGWIRSMPRSMMSDEEKRVRIDKCMQQVDESIEQDHDEKTHPLTEEERRLCVRCDMDACKNRPTWQSMKKQQDGKPSVKGPENIAPAPQPGVEAPSPAPGIAPGPHHPPDGSLNHCRPIMHGRVRGVQNRVRKEIHQWTDDEFKVFARAVNAMKDKDTEEIPDDYPHTWASFVAIHPKGHYANDGPKFMPWHRHMTYDLETELQRVANNCSLTLPYWNSNLEAGEPMRSRIWEADRYGGKGGSPTSPGGRPCKGAAPDGKPDHMGYCLTDGIAADWKVAGHEGPEDICKFCVHRSPQNHKVESFARIVQKLQSTPKYEQANDYIEFQIHTVVHSGTVGGSMGDIPIASRDPIFYAHHVYVDRLFAMWQEYHRAHGVDTSNCETCNRNLRFFGEPLEEWIGEWSVDMGCVLVPKSSPRTCISYEGEMPDPEGPHR